VTASTFYRLALAFGIAVAAIEIGWLIAAPLPYDAFGYMIGRDFVATWAGAKAALTGDPGQYFGYAAYNALLQNLFGAHYPPHIWSYPPHLLLFTWPLAFLPYMAAYALYCALGLILYVAVVTDGERRWDHIALLALAPAVMLNVWTGQNGFITTALLIGGLIQLDRRPLLAGILFGILSIKPQLGLLLPLLLLLTGRWRVIAAAAATVAVLAALTCLAFGTKAWTDYLHLAMPVQSRAITEGSGFFLTNMPTAFMNLRLIGMPAPFTYTVQAIISAATLAAVVWVFWRRRDPVLSLCFFVSATFLFTPYAFNYDMVAFGWVMLKLLQRSDNDGWDYTLMLAVWVIPFVTILMGLASLPGSFLPILALAARLFWRIQRSALTMPARGPEGSQYRQPVRNGPVPIRSLSY
jgi:alpha-1,2-mannosyltransferase